MQRGASLALLLAAAVGLAAADAGAARLTLTSDKPVYSVGEIIVLGFLGEVATQPPFDSALGVFVRIEYDAALTEGVSATLLQGHRNRPMGPLDAPRGFIGIAGDGAAHVLEQFFAISHPVTISANAIATVRLIAEAPGTVHVAYFVEPGSPLTLNYFGITSHPGIQFRIVPEPAAAALLVLGLAALAGAGRRERPHSG